MIRIAWPDGVVLHRPQTLIPSSSSTTPDGRIGARGRTAWCLTARKPLSLRRRAPRRMDESEHGDGRRGASPPANPYPFVVEHHVGWANQSTGTDGVVPHRPLSLVSSSPGTTSHRLIRLGDGRRGASPPVNPCFFVVEHHAPDFLQPDNSGNPPRVPGIPISPKKRKMSARCCSSSTLPTFPFPLSISRDCPSLHIEGTVSILSYPNPLLC